MDSTQPESLAPRMPSVRPDVTVNAAALRALQMQADCVFDCSGSTPRDELSFTGPKSVYGRTNLEAMHRVVRPRATS